MIKRCVIIFSAAIELGAPASARSTRYKSSVSPRPNFFFFFLSLPKFVVVPPRDAFLPRNYSIQKKRRDERELLFQRDYFVQVSASASPAQVVALSSRKESSFKTFRSTYTSPRLMESNYYVVVVNHTVKTDIMDFAD